jgi:multidrug resistance efflux pump
MSEPKKPEQKQEQHRPEQSKPNIIQKIRQHAFFLEIVIFTVLIIVIAGILVYSDISSKISIDLSTIYAPTITLSSATPGVLERVYVSVGDTVGKGKVVALIGNNTLTTLTGGIITSVQNTPGQIVNSQTPIVEMIDPNQLRVIGHIDEDKGLADLRVGQKVTFTVDAYGSKAYDGVVESIAPSARQQDIVFSISNNRPVNQFDITVKFDVDKYPELKNGMSAKMKIYKE